MKHLIKTILCLLLVATTFTAHAVYVEKMPVNQIQPSGDTIHFFVTGDECYHRFHDAANYTIVQDHAGYWVYAIPSQSGGIQPSSYRVGTVDPATLGIHPGLRITKTEWIQRRKAWEIPEQYRITQPKTSGRNHGDYCNLVIFIRFADDSAYTRAFSSIDRMWSDSSSATSTSVYNYFKHVSYNKLFVRTYYAPAPDSNTILSYQSPHPRGYYMPYNDYNTIGYTNYSERTEREFELLVGAVNYINDSAPVPTSYNLDCNNDGYVDNVNFIVKGSYTGWNDLLWPHKWNLYGQEVFINGKQVSTFNLALEGSGADYFGPSTFCHEMFHSLGAPDLYRYNDEVSNISPVGSWDLMATNTKPQQNMSAYMKYKYGNWIDSIPLITTPGTYTLNSVADSVPGTNIYRIPSADPDQFYVIEYRDNTEIFDTKIPGKGLLIYRIDTRFNGNASYDGEENFDEVWLFRPGSADGNTNGTLGHAFYSSLSRRTSFSPDTDPFPYLSDGTRDYTITINNITIPGRTISFHYTNRTRPANLSNTNVTTATATLAWNGNSDTYRVRYRQKGSNDPYTYRLVHTNRLTITGLTPNTMYEWAVRALYDPTGDNHYADSTSLSANATLLTQLCNNSVTNVIDNNFGEQRTGIPFTTDKKYNYSQQIFLASEMDGEQSISSIKLHFAYNSLEKENCTIYLANTQLDHFDDTTSPLPFNQLTPVYTGTLHFVKGWNSIILDTQFHYNGTDNLLLAIDDNSGTSSYPSDKFYINNTNDFKAICYYSDTYNPDPEQDTIKGTLQRLLIRNNIQFVGCPIYHDQFYACVISDNENLGQVSGAGLYPPNYSIRIYAHPHSGNQFVRWNDNNTDNPRDIVITQDTIFIAFFHSPLGIDNPEHSGGYIVTTHQLQLTVQGATQQPIHIFDLMGRHIASAPALHPDNTTFDLPHSGVYLVRIGNEKPVKIFVR